MVIRTKDDLSLNFWAAYRLPLLSERIINELNYEINNFFVLGTDNFNLCYLETLGA